MREGAGAVDAAEVAKFEAIAAEWWDPNGRFRPLHRLNPCRLGYLTEQIAAEFGRDPAAEAPLEGLRVLDLGCGGGLVTEPMARLGAAVLGADPSEGTVPVARLHAARMGLSIDYRATTAEALAAAGERFDVVITLEVIEHVPDPAGYLRAVAALTRPGGLVVVSTLNRTAKAYALAVVGAERVLGWLPPGTHDWAKFVTPEELAAMLEAAGLEVVDRKGFVHRPLHGDWRVDPADLSVNYVMTAVKPA